MDRNHFIDSPVFQFLVLPRLNIVTIRRLSSLRKQLILATNNMFFWREHVHSIRLRHLDSIIEQLPDSYRRYALMYSPRKGRSLYYAGQRPYRRDDTSVPQKISTSRPILQFYANYELNMEAHEFILYENHELEIHTFDRGKDLVLGTRSNIERVITGSNGALFLAPEGRFPSGLGLPEKIVDGFNGHWYKLLITESGLLYIIKRIEDLKRPEVFLVPVGQPVLKAVHYYRNDTVDTIRVLQSNGQLIELTSNHERLNDRLELISRGRKYLSCDDPKFLLRELYHNIVDLRAFREEVITIGVDEIHRLSQYHGGERTMKKAVVRYSSWTHDRGHHCKMFLRDDGFVDVMGRTSYGQLGIGVKDDRDIDQLRRVELPGVLEVIALPKVSYFLCER